MERARLLARLLVDHPSVAARTIIDTVDRALLDVSRVYPDGPVAKVEELARFRLKKAIV